MQKYVDEMKRTPGVFPVKLDVVNAYGAKVIEISRIIKESKYDVILCPLRGARLPGIQSDLMCYTEVFEPFDGSDLGKGWNEARILADLRRIILDRPLTSQRRNIGILDTAKGGDSCRELARLLRQVNDEAQENWDVHFHLIHAEGTYPSRSTDAYGFKSKTLEIQIHPHEVIDLLIEDESAALGYDTKRSSGQSWIQPFKKEGRVMVFGINSVTTYRQAPLDETMIALLAKEIMTQIQTMSDIIPIDMDHWPNSR